MKINKIIALFSASAIMLTCTFMPECKLLLKADAVTDNTVCSKELRSNDFGYKKFDEDNDGSYDYIKITDYFDESANEIAIPDKIDGLEIKGIEDFAFWRIENKLSIVIPDTLDSEYVGKYALITADVIYRNAVLPSKTDSLEGILKYYLNDYGFKYSDDKVDSYVDYAITIVSASERDFDINSLSISQFLAILFDEILLGKTSISESNISDFKIFLNTFAYRGIEIISYYSKSNMKDYAKKRVGVKYNLLKPVTIENAGVSISDVNINQDDNTALLDINLNNLTSKGLDIFVYCNSPLEILEISGAYNTYDSSEYGDSCIQSVFITQNEESLKDKIASVKISVPDNTEPGTYPVFLVISNLKNESGVYVNKPVAVNGSVTIKENIAPPKPTESTRPTSLTETTALTESSSDSIKTTESTNTTVSDTTTASSAIDTLSTAQSNTSDAAATTTTTIESETTAAATTTANAAETTADTSSNNDFVWGKDNWNFQNNDTIFSKYTIDDSYSDTLRKNVKNTEWSDINKYSNKKQKDFSYGMSALAVLSKNGLLPYSRYTAGSNDLFSMDSPDKNSEINSLISYYTYLQFKDNISQLELRTMINSHEANINNIISQLQTSPMVLLGYQEADRGKHTVAAYDVTYGLWTINGTEYDGRIEILDPDSSDKYDENRCIYFNKTTYDWEIPAYKIGSQGGAVFTLALSDVSVINSGGYLDGTSYESKEDYYSKLEVSADKSFEINKVRKTDNNIFITETINDGEMIPTAFYDIITQKSINGYVLKDSGAGYKFTQTAPGNTELKISFLNGSYNVSASSGSEIIFDPSGYASIRGSDTAYDFNMTFNEDYPTDWFRINISGKNANNFSVKKAEKGYFLYCDSFEDTAITASNDKNTVNYRFSTECSKVYVYEVNKTTLGVSADIDNDGIYETRLENNYKERMIGDVSGNGVLDIRDVIMVAKSFMKMIKLTDEEFTAADINCDGRVNLQDAIAIAKRMIDKINKTGDLV